MLEAASNSPLSRAREPAPSEATSRVRAQTPAIAFFSSFFLPTWKRRRQDAPACEGRRQDTPARERRRQDAPSTTRNSALHDVFLWPS